MSALPATLLLEENGEETPQGFTVRQTYQVFTTSNADGGSVVLTAAGLPAMYASYSGDPLSLVTSRRPIRQKDSTTHWHVEIGYSKETGNSQDSQSPPTLRPTKRSAKTRWIEKALMHDRNDKPIITSAKTPLNPPITIQVPHPVVTFQRWETSFSTSTQLQYLGKVNSAAFGAYEAGMVMCTALDASEEWEQDASGNLQRYWLVTYEFEANPDKFDPLKILDADYWFIDPDDSKRKPIYVDKDGAYHGNPDNANGATPVPSPIPLKGEAPNLGNVLVAADIPSLIHYLEFNVYETADFNALGLPVN